MESRSIQKVGNRSYAVSLPKEWVIGNKLKEKMEVFLDITQNNELLITPHPAEMKTGSEISADISKIKNLPEFLVFCYVKNVDKITLTSKKIEYAHSRSVKDVLKYLEGYDVTYEDGSKIIIEFLFKDVSITLKQLMKRMSHLLGIMKEAVGKRDEKTLDETETEIDRLYHLSKRILFSCLSDRKRREENKIALADELFFMNIIFKKLENIADNIYAFKKRKASAPELKTMDELIDLLNSAIYAKKELHEIKQSVIDLVGNKKPGANADLISGMQKQCFDILENFISLDFNKEYFIKKS